jgi:hypothetical protein
MTVVDSIAHIAPGFSFMAPRCAADDDWNGDDDDCFMPCPYCDRSIHEDSERCPYCENYISEEDMPGKTKPFWIILGVLACLLIVLVWILLESGR